MVNTYGRLPITESQNKDDDRTGRQTHLSADGTVVVLLFVVLLQLVLIAEVLTAFLAIVVPWRGDPVLLQLIERREVPVAEEADVMRARVLFMLLKSAVVREITFATLAVSHSQAGRQERERGYEARVD